MQEAVGRFVPDGASVCMGTALDGFIPFAAGCVVRIQAAALQAGAMGAPDIPTRSLLGHSRRHADGRRHAGVARPLDLRRRGLEGLSLDAGSRGPRSRAGQDAAPL
jgi:hypothetical protein